MFPKTKTIYPLSPWLTFVFGAAIIFLVLSFLFQDLFFMWLFLVVSVLMFPISIFPTAIKIDEGGVIYGPTSRYGLNDKADLKTIETIEIHYSHKISWLSSYLLRFVPNQNLASGRVSFLLRRYWFKRDIETLEREIKSRFPKIKFVWIQTRALGLVQN